MEAAAADGKYRAEFFFRPVPQEPADGIGDLRHHVDRNVGDLLLAADLGPEPFGAGRRSARARDEYDADGCGRPDRGIRLRLGGTCDRAAADDAGLFCDLFRNVLYTLQAQRVVE